MSTPEDRWNPEDGPPPSDEERSAAGAFADALKRPTSAPVDDLSDALQSLVATARRLDATVHPDPDAARAVAARAVERAAQRARSPWARPWVRRLSVAAAGLSLLGGAGLLATRGLTPPRATPGISRPAEDALQGPVEAGAGSMPSSRIYDSRLHDYRAVLLRGRSR
ncbi:MAG: hypothetical protein HY909_16980 [Deltaproteobacteria bacterium]|nr:hypothetical protein [Deltaproteobacteria bacterium]